MKTLKPLRFRTPARRLLASAKPTDKINLGVQTSLSLIRATKNAVGDESTDKTRIIDYGTDEFAPKPLSMENVADKAFMLIARDALKGDN